MKDLGLTNFPARRRGHLNSQDIFSILDNLTMWCEEYKLGLNVGKLD
jgi:hypothetical protein